MSYQDKYLKYYNKYLELSGGANPNMTPEEKERLMTLMMVLNRKNRQANERISKGQKTDTPYLPLQMKEHIRDSYITDFETNKQFIISKYRNHEVLLITTGFQLFDSIVKPKMNEPYIRYLIDSKLNNRLSEPEEALLKKVFNVSENINIEVVEEDIYDNTILKFSINYDRGIIPIGPREIFVDVFLERNWKYYTEGLNEYNNLKIDNNDKYNYIYKKY